MRSEKGEVGIGVQGESQDAETVRHRTHPQSKQSKGTRCFFVFFPFPTSKHAFCTMCCCLFELSVV